MARQVPVTVDVPAGAGQSVSTVQAREQKPGAPGPVDRQICDAQSALLWQEPPSAALVPVPVPPAQRPFAPQVPPPQQSALVTQRCPAAAHAQTKFVQVPVQQSRLCEQPAVAGWQQRLAGLQLAGEQHSELDVHATASPGLLHAPTAHVPRSQLPLQQSEKALHWLRSGRHWRH